MGSVDSLPASQSGSWLGWGAAPSEQRSLQCVACTGRQSPGSLDVSQQGGVQVACCKQVPPGGEGRKAPGSTRCPPRSLAPSPRACPSGCAPSWPLHRRSQVRPAPASWTEEQSTLLAFQWHAAAMALTSLGCSTAWPAAAQVLHASTPDRDGPARYCSGHGGLACASSLATSHRGLLGLASSSKGSWMLLTAWPASGGPHDVGAWLMGQRLFAQLPVSDALRCRARVQEAHLTVWPAPRWT